MSDGLLRLIPYIYMAGVSFTALSVTVYDKWAAKKRPKGRIRERTLLLWAILGGSFAMYITMRAIRHKTKHLSFMAGIPLIMVLQLAALLVAGYLLG